MNGCHVSCGQHVALLTGGGDRPYAIGLAKSIASKGVLVDFVGSDDLDVPALRNNPRVRFFNLRGNQRAEADFRKKALRVVRYYVRLVRYVATARPKVLHILWNNKFEFIDRICLMWYYRLLGKRLVFTAHNVNAGMRDANDSFLNKLSLRAQYRLSDHIFVHTEKMNRELALRFRVPEGKVTVIPFGINNTVPNTALTITEARRSLGIGANDKVLLFFGNIAPYKGLEYLLAAFSELIRKDCSYRLTIAGSPKGPAEYWQRIHQAILKSEARDRIIETIEYVPDAQTELYFKAADVLILPYTHVFQSGVLFLGYSFGLPAIAADVGSLKEEIIEGKTGFVFKPQNSSDLADTIHRYFESDLFHNLEKRRLEIKQYANERYSWDKVAAITTNVYLNLLGTRPPAGA